MTVTKNLVFYFDYISPYAYLAFHQIYPVAARTGRDVELTPMLFAAALSHWGHKGPAEIPPKRVYTFKDTYRRAANLSIPFSSPPTHPFNPLWALRVTQCLAPHERKPLVEALFASTWGKAERRGIDTREAVEAIAHDIGLDGQALCDQASQPASKARLRESTDAAVDAGVFGVPTIIADGELFWGVDSLPHLEAYLEGRDPLPPRLLAKLASLPASASRKRGGD